MVDATARVYLKVPPFDHPMVIAGQGTWRWSCCWSPKLRVFRPGGWRRSGSGRGGADFEQLMPQIKVIGGRKICLPEGAALDAGHPVEIRAARASACLPWLSGQTSAMKRHRLPGVSDDHHRRTAMLSVGGEGSVEDVRAVGGIFRRGAGGMKSIAQHIPWRAHWLICPGANVILPTSLRMCPSA